MQEPIRTTEQLTLHFLRWRSNIEVPSELSVPLYWAALGIDERNVAELNTMYEVGEIAHIDYCAELAKIVQDRDELIAKYNNL